MTRTAFVALLAFAPAAAFAVPFTVSQTVPVAPFVVSAATASSISGNTAFDVSLIDVFLDPFDDSLGELVSVRFLPSVTVEGSLSGVSGGSLAFTAAGDLGVDGATYESLSASRSSSSTIGGVSADVTLTDDTTIDAASIDPTDQSILTSVTAASPYNFTLVGDQIFNRFATGTLEVTEGSVTVEYSYVPEPTSATVVAACGVMAGLANRRRRSA